MTLQTINLGLVANDSSGDTLRTAFQKIASNFSVINARSAEPTAVNLGSGAGIFAGLNQSQLEFKSLVAGDHVLFHVTPHSVTISADIGVSSFQVQADQGSIVFTENSTFSLRGARLVQTAQTDDHSIEISTTAIGSIQDDPEPQLSNNLNANFYNINNVDHLHANSVSGSFFGNLVGLVHGIDIRDLNFYRNPQQSWNFGAVLQQLRDNRYAWVFETYPVDMGPIAGVKPNLKLDFGIDLVNSELGDPGGDLNEPGGPGGDLNEPGGPGGDLGLL